MGTSLFVVTQWTKQSEVVQTEEQLLSRRRRRRPLLTIYLSIIITTNILNRILFHNS